MRWLDRRHHRGAAVLEEGARNAGDDWVESWSRDTAELRVEWVDTEPVNRWSWRTDPPRDPDVVDVIVDGPDDVVLRVRLGRPDADGPVVLGFEVVDDEARLGTRMLRRLGFGGILHDIDVVLADEIIGRTLGLAWHRPVARVGRRGHDDLYYARWAARYVEAMKQDPKKPIEWMVADAERRGLHLTAAQVRAHLHRARSRGLLTASPLGKAGGRLTAHARRLLDWEATR